jgi:hypothetical protein
MESLSEGWSLTKRIKFCYLNILKNRVTVVDTSGVVDVIVELRLFLGT